MTVIERPLAPIAVEHAPEHRIPAPLLGPGRAHTAALLVVSLVMSAPIVGAFVLDAVGVPLRTASVAGVSAAALLVGLWLCRGLPNGRSAAPLLAAAFAGAATFVVALATAWPTLLTPSISVDAVHHYLLADYIYRHLSLVHGTDEADHLGEMLVYPFGPSLLAAVAAHAANVRVVFLMHVVPSLALASMAFFGAATLAELAGGVAPTWLVAVLAPVALLAAPEYTVGQFTREYFGSQVWAIACLVALWFWLIQWTRYRRSIALLPMAFLAGGVLFSYPTLLPVFGLSFVVAPLVASPRPSLRNHALALAAVGLPVAALAIPYLANPLRVDVGFQILRHGGASIDPSLGTFPPAFAALALIGLAWATVVRRLRPAAVFAWCTLLEAAAFRAATSLSSSFEIYHALKVFYLLAPELAVLAALGLVLVTDAAARRLPWTALRRLLPTALAAALAASVAATWASGLGGFVPRVSSPLTPDLLATAAWVQANVPPRADHERERSAAFATWGDTTPAYWLDVALLGADRRYWNQSLKRITSDGDFWSWYADPAADRYAVVTGDLDRLLGPAVNVVFRAGDTAVLERAPDADVALVGRELVIAARGPEVGPHAPGDPVAVHVDLHVAAAPTSDYALVARLVDAAGRAWGETSVPVSDPGGPPDLPVGAHRTVDLTIHPTDPPAGLYRIEVLAFRLPDWRSTPLTGWGSGAAQRRYLLGPLLVASPGDLPTADQPAEHAIGARFGDQVELAGVDGPTVAGSRLDVALRWRALRRPDRDYSVFVQLLDTQGRLVAQADGYPWQGGYPTSAWEAGTSIRDHRSLTLPDDLAPGDYQLIAGLYRLDTLARLPLAPPPGDSARLATVTLGR